MWETHVENADTFDLKVTIYSPDAREGVVEACSGRDPGVGLRFLRGSGRPEEISLQLIGGMMMSYGRCDAVLSLSNLTDSPLPIHGTESKNRSVKQSLL